MDVQKARSIATKELRAFIDSLRLRWSLRCALSQLPTID